MNPTKVLQCIGLIIITVSSLAYITLNQPKTINPHVCPPYAHTHILPSGEVK